MEKDKTEKEILEQYSKIAKEIIKVEKNNRKENKK